MNTILQNEFCMIFGQTVPKAQSDWLNIFYPFCFVRFSLLHLLHHSLCQMIVVEIAEQHKLTKRWAVKALQTQSKKKLNKNLLCLSIDIERGGGPIPLSTLCSWTCRPLVRYFINPFFSFITTPT